MRRRVRKLASIIGVCALVIAGLLVLAPTSGGALTQIVVANSTDSDPGSLRAAVLSASVTAGDVEIIIPASVGNIALTSSQLYYTGSFKLTLRGSGTTITAAPNSRVIEIAGTAQQFTLDGLVLTGGNGASLGGAISSQGGGSVVVTNSTLTGNNVTDSGGAIHMFGHLTLTNSTISNNTAASAAGGAFAAGGVTMTGSTISGNNAGTGAGLHFDTSGTITNSTITGNTAAGDAGGILADDDLTLQYATITGNTSTTGGTNIHFRGDRMEALTLTSFGSVVANPLGGGTNCAGQGTVITSYNFEDANSCGFGAGTGDQTNAGSPQLGALANNGGPTQTMAPSASSGLVDKIPASSPCGGVNVTVDQRGLPRPVTAGQSCDIGAYEIQVAALESDRLTFTG